MRFPTGTAVRFPRMAAGEPGRARSWASPRASGARLQEPGSSGRAGRPGAGSRAPAGALLRDRATGPVSVRVRGWAPAAAGCAAMGIAGSFPRDARGGRLRLCQCPEGTGGKGRVCCPFPAARACPRCIRWLRKVRCSSEDQTPRRESSGC